MKKFTYLFLASLMIASCQKDNKIIANEASLNQSQKESKMELYFFIESALNIITSNDDSAITSLHGIQYHALKHDIISDRAYIDGENFKLYFLRKYGTGYGNPRWTKFEFFSKGYTATEKDKLSLSVLIKQSIPTPEGLKDADFSEFLIKYKNVELILKLEPKIKQLDKTDLKFETISIYRKGEW